MGKGFLIIWENIFFLQLMTIIEMPGLKSYSVAQQKKYLYVHFDYQTI